MIEYTQTGVDSALEVFVEFVGLPAAGKTRLAHEVQSQLERELPTTEVTTSSDIRTDRSMPAVAVRVCGEVMRSPGAAAQALRTIARSDQDSVRRLLRYWIYQVYLGAELRHTGHESCLHLADQGFIQHVWRLHLTGSGTGREDVRELLERYIATVPDIVVFVDVDHRTRMQRGVRRGTPVQAELFDPDHPEIQRDIQSYQDVTDTVHDVTDHATAPSRVIHVENTAEALESNVALLRDAILRAWSTAP